MLALLPPNFGLPVGFICLQAGVSPHAFFHRTFLKRFVIALHHDPCTTKYNILDISDIFPF